MPVSAMFPVQMWRLPVRIRILLATLFYRGGRYSLRELLENIFDSDAIRKVELHEAQPRADRFRVLSDALKVVGGVEGDIAEFGVFKGETLKLLVANAPLNKRLYGFDSFEGLPEDWGGLLPKGFFSTNVPQIAHPNVELVVGRFEQTLGAFLEEKDPKFSLVHIDCDLYSATTFVLEKILGRIPSGGVVVFDEYYGYPSFEQHEYLAWKEVMLKTGRKATPILYSSHSCAFILE